MSRLARLAATAPAPVFAAIGPGLAPAVERLLARPGLRRAATPRDAALLLVAGAIPDRTAGALDRVHDQVPHPRRTVRWDGTGDIERALLDARADLLGGGESAPDRRPDAPPAPWRGKGDHGQGGEGMMGGTPYGRPMAMTGADIRDGLQLDRYTARVGPFAPMLPPGLVLEVTLQGDVIVAVEVQAPAFDQPAEADAPDLVAARMLRLLGLPGAADRVAAGGRPRAAGLLRAVPPGLAPVSGRDARDRLAGCLAGRSQEIEPPDLAALLPGLEWAEAMLALASLPPSSLAQEALAA